MSTRLPSQLTYNDLNGAEAIEILTDWFRHLLSSQPLLQPHLTLPMAKISLDIGVQIDMYVGGTVPVASPPDRVDITGAVTLSNDLSAHGGRSVHVVDSSLVTRSVTEPSRETRLATVINAAPLPGGVPPDQIREQHELPVPRPGYGSRETGSHMFLSDVIAVTDAGRERKGIVANGYQFAEPTSAQVLEQTIQVDQGSIQIDMTGTGIHHESGITVRAPDHRASVKEAGDMKGSKYGSVNGVLDAGPAGLMRRSANGGGGLGSDGRSRLSFGNNH